MKSKELRKRIFQNATNEALKSKFIKELGSKGRVDRSSVENDHHVDQLRTVVSDVAHDLQKIGKVNAGMTYRGSLTIHVFSSEILRVAEFITLNNLETLDGGLADAACRELNNNVKMQFGKNPQRLKSGF